MAGKKNPLMAVVFLLIIGVGLTTLAVPMSIVQWVELDGIDGFTATEMEEPAYNVLTLQFQSKDDFLLTAWKGYDIEMVKSYPNYFIGVLAMVVLSSLGFIYSVRNMVKERD